MVRKTVEDFPNLKSMWSDKNSCLPSQAGITRKKRFLWNGLCGHEFLMSSYSLAHGAKCPVCAGRVLLRGFNDLATTHTELSGQWNVQKNGDLSPQDVSRGSTKVVWWMCERGHEWKSTVKNRAVLGRGCPACSGKRVAVGETDLGTKFPEIASEWGDNEKSPQEVSFGSDYEAEWVCAHGHHWKTKVSNRTIKGNGCPVCSGRKVVQGENDLATRFPWILKEWDDPKNPTCISFGSGERANWVCDAGHRWSARVCDRVGKKRGCPQCVHQISQSESDLSDFISSILPKETEICRNDRSVIPPKELDMYVPEKHIAIEFNGLYWHSEANGKDRRYHFDKWKRCHEQGIQLITVWEDDWRDEPEIVKSMLKHKLGVDDSQRIGARKCEVKESDFRVARDFLNANHIQGFVQGSRYISLVNDGEIVAMSVFQKHGDELVLARYATSITVMGGQSKILSYVDNNIPYSRMVTFADHEVSDGGLYERTGWMRDKEIPPDYRYVYDGVRRHKFGFRKIRFKNDPNLLWVDGLKERELAELNHINRVWDCGKTRFVREVA